MSSNPERTAQLRFSLGLTFWFLVIFVLTAVGLYVLTSHLVRGALAEEWGLEQSEVRGTLTDTGDVESVTVRKVAMKAVPTPQVQAAVTRHFNRFFPILMVPVIVIGVAGGLFLTYRSTTRLRSVIRTVHEILHAGAIHRRVPLRGLGGPLREVAGLFNRALERNEALITGLHESLDNVAHDLRTPMTRLRAVAETALTAPDDAGICKSAISDCLEESENVLRMLDTLMDLAEAETGTMRLDLEDVCLPEVVRSVEELYEFVAEEKGVSFEADVPEKLVVHADRGRLRQLLANLVDNAIKYGAEGGMVRVAARQDGAEAALAVTDRGPGIPEDDLPRVWDRLYRGDRSRHERGLGLGLSFVRAIAEAHGGSVRATSRAGEGTTVEVRLPAGVDDADPQRRGGPEIT